MPSRAALIRCGMEFGDSGEVRPEERSYVWYRMVPCQNHTLHDHATTTTVQYYTNQHNMLPVPCRTTRRACGPSPLLRLTPPGLGNGLLLMTCCSRYGHRHATAVMGAARC